MVWLGLTLAAVPDVELRIHGFAWFVEHPERKAGVAARVRLRAAIAGTT